MLEWIVSSTLLILAVTALRAVSKGRISFRMRYALWLLAALRLLIPVNFGAAELSVGNFTRRAAETESVKMISGFTQTTLPRMTYGAAYTEVAEEYAEKGVDISALPAEEFEAVDYEILSRMDGAWNIREILTVVWLLGAAAVGFVLLAANIGFAAKLRKTRRELEAPSSALPVYLSPATETPCLFGVLHPAVYVTPEAADDTALRHVVAHELTHFRHGDHIWPLLRGVCLALHWYNPAVWWAASLSQRDAELACDEATIERLGEDERAAYGRTLLQMTCGKRQNMLRLATTMTGGKNVIKERIVSIAKKPKPAFLAVAAVLLLAALAAGCTFTGAVTADSPAPAGISSLPETVPGLSDEQAILQLLYNPIAAAIEEYYGEPRQYWEQEVIDVQEVPESPDYKVIIQVETFLGAHNPPYGLETMTFHVGPDEVQLLSFDHKALTLERKAQQIIDDIPGVPLSEEELARFNEMFTSVAEETDGPYPLLYALPVSCFFTSLYDDVTELDFLNFLWYHPSDGVLGEEDAAEFEALSRHPDFHFKRTDKETLTADDLPVPTHRILRSSVDETLQIYAGITAADLKNTENVLYLPEYDAYYVFTSDFGPGAFHCEGGKRDGDTVRLWSGVYGSDGSRDILTLWARGGENYHIRALQNSKYIERKAAVPAKREAIVLEDIGVSLILPDNWRGRYVVTPQKYGPGCHVYVKMIYDWCVDVGEIHPELGEADPGAGHLFSVALCDDTPMTAEEFYAQDGHAATYLLSTEDGTYCVGYPTDVQWPTLPIYPPSAAEKTTAEQVAAMEQEYLAMERETAEIQIVLNHIPAGTLAQNSPSE